MCELLGMSANVPTDICFSFRGLMRRGGGTGPHKDGWGIVFYEAKGIREFRDPEPGVESEIARLIENYPIKSCCVISHIRQANVGSVSLENTHPFTRELWGQNWTFAHNGQLQDFSCLPLDKDRPVGTTDSEHAFCWLLGELRKLSPDRPLPKAELYVEIRTRLDTLHSMGVSNVLLSNGEFLLAYCSKSLSWITRRAPFGIAKLSDAELSVDFAGETTPNDIVTVIATAPLTHNEQWTIMQPGEMVVFVDGCEHASAV